MNDKERLEAYDNMHREIQELYLEASAKIETLKSQGKTKTVSFREALSHKGFYAHVILLYESHGIKSDILYNCYRQESDKALHNQ